MGRLLPTDEQTRRLVVADHLNRARQLVGHFTGEQLTPERAAKIKGHLAGARRALKLPAAELETGAKRRATSAEARAELRRRVFAAYGGRCACCGESDPRAHTIDHIEPLNGRRRKGDIYRRLLREGCPAGYQVLCLNCNMLKGTGPSCPHGSAGRGAGRES